MNFISTFAFSHNSHIFLQKSYLTSTTFLSIDSLIRASPMILSLSFRNRTEPSLLSLSRPFAANSSSLLSNQIEHPKMIGLIKILLLSVVGLAVAIVVIVPVVMHFKGKDSPSTMPTSTLHFSFRSRAWHFLRFILQIRQQHQQPMVSDSQKEQNEWIQSRHVFMTQ